MTTRKSTASKVSANEGVVSFYVADDVRQELHGKVSLVGLYPDRVVIAQMEDDSPIASDALIGLDSLAFLFNISSLSGKHRIRVSYLDESVPEPVSSPEQERDFTAGKSANLIMRFRPFTAKQFGVKNMLVEIDGRTQQLQFEIRRATAKPIAVETAKAGARPAKKKRAL